MHQLQDMKRTINLVGMVSRTTDKPGDKPGDKPKCSFNVVGMGWEHYIPCDRSQLPTQGSVVEVECEWSEFDGKTKPGKIVHIETFDGASSAPSAEPPRRSAMLGAGKAA